MQLPTRMWPIWCNNSPPRLQRTLSLRVCVPNILKRRQQVDHVFVVLHSLLGELRQELFPLRVSILVRQLIGQMRRIIQRLYLRQ